MDVLKPKVEVRIVDGNRIYVRKGFLDTQRHVVEVSKGFRKAPEIFLIKSESHIYEEWKQKAGGKLRLNKLVIYVDNNARETIELVEKGGKLTVEANPSFEIKTASELDLKKRLTLSFLSLEAFFKHIAGRQKIPTLQLVLTLLAGAGLYHVFLVILRVMGFHV
jgi:hypothetical protein